MIIRKPYAFLIKNFRKLHILLFLLGAFIFYKTIDTFLFVNEFMNVGFYDLYANPIAEHINSLLIFIIIITIIGTASILLLLVHKKKKWKSYLIPFIVYIVLLFVLLMIKSFFITYTDMVDSANLRLSKDLLVILFIGQLPSLWIFLRRIFGLDVKDLDFNVDLDNLNLSEDDREEVEVSFDFDFYSVKRLFRRLFRNLGYFYKEHKIISTIIITIFSLIIIWNIFAFFFITNRVYKQGQLYRIDGFTIKINNSYFSDKDDTGNVISKSSNFVIVEVSVKNHLDDRTFDTSNFHLKSGLRSYSTTDSMYQKEFSDLGSCLNKTKIIKKGETVNFIIIYKVNKGFLNKKSVIYYQEKGGLYKLRKIKLKIKDISKLDKAVDLKVGEMFDVTIKNYDETLSFDEVKYEKNVTYRTNKCNTQRCDQSNKNYSAPNGESILVLNFGSDVFESQNMIDFLTKYGTIIYKDNKGKTIEIEIENAVEKKYYGKVVFLRVKDEVASSSDVLLHIVMRNKVYNYHLS